MIGFVSTGKSFYHCLSYCLEDKKELSETQKLLAAHKDHLQHKNRAEILDFNLCFGDKKELVQQFTDVKKLNRKIEKPVFHFALRLAPSDELSKDQLAEIGRSCAKEFGLEKNQFITVLHKDTAQNHIHIVANRVGLDGKVATDSNSYKKMAALCRKLEKQYGLQQVLSPKRFLSARERLQPRYDSRKIQLQKDIKKFLIVARNYKDFEQKMQAIGYAVIKGRGIAFIDNKKVRTKGSEVGYSLRRIEAVFDYKQGQKQPQYVLAPFKQANLLTMPGTAFPMPSGQQCTASKIVHNMLETLLAPRSADSDHIDPGLLNETKKKKKKKKSQGQGNHL